jgi:hypothetical protein
MAPQRTVSIPYCIHCHALCLEYTESVARYGEVTNALDDNGYTEEIDFDWRDSETFDKLCQECGEDLDNYVEFDLFTKIKQRVTEDNTSNFSVKIELTEEYSSYEEIPPEIVRDQIFEGLL